MALIALPYFTLSFPNHKSVGLQKDSLTSCFLQTSISLLGASAYLNYPPGKTVSCPSAVTYWMLSQLEHRQHAGEEDFPRAPPYRVTLLPCSKLQLPNKMLDTFCPAVSFPHGVPGHFGALASVNHRESFLKG